MNVEYFGEFCYDESRTMILYNKEQKNGRRMRMKFNYTDGHSVLKDFNYEEVNAIFHFLNSFDDPDGDIDVDGLMKARDLLRAYF